MKRTREFKAGNVDYSVAIKISFNGGEYITRGEQNSRFEGISNVIFDALRAKFDASEIKMKVSK